MAAAALTFREALEVWLVITAVRSFVGGSAREHLRPVLVAIGAAFLLGATLRVGAGVFGASFGVKAKPVLPRAMMVLGALLTGWAMLIKPPYGRLERRPAVRPDGGCVSVAPVVFRLISITIFMSVLLYGCEVGTWWGAALFGGVRGTTTGVVVGLLGTAAIVLFERLAPRTRRAPIGMLVFFRYLVAVDARALPQGALISSPHLGPDRSVSPIATVLGIASAGLIARLALRRVELQPRPSLVLRAATALWSSR